MTEEEIGRLQELTQERRVSLPDLLHQEAVRRLLAGPQPTMQDVRHASADAALRQLMADEEPLVCASHVLLESFALAQNRLGMDGVRDLQDRICPLLEMEWVDQGLHDAGVAGLVAANRRQLSLVNCVSFAAMRRLGIERVFTFDAHFGEQRFQLVTGTT